MSDAADRHLNLTNFLRLVLLMLHTRTRTVLTFCFIQFLDKIDNFDIYLYLFVFSVQVFYSY